MIDKDRFVNFLNKSCVEYTMLDFEQTQEECFTAKIQCKLPALGTRLEECQTFLRKFSSFSSTNWIVLGRRPSVQRLEFRKSYVCQHSSRNKDKHSSGNLMCRATIDFKVKKINRDTIKKDALLKAGQNVVIYFDFNHSHRIHVSTVYGSLRCDTETQETFETYFQQGKTVAVAKKYHEMVLSSTYDGDELKIKLANAQINPTVRQVQHLYENWRKKTCGGQPENEMVPRMEGDAQRPKQHSNRSGLSEVILPDPGSSGDINIPESSPLPQENNYSPAQNEDSLKSDGNEIKVFCPKCDAKISHTAEGLQEDRIKIIIAKVYHYLEQEYEELKKSFDGLKLTSLSKFSQRTALATGVSETTVVEILREEARHNAEAPEEPSPNESCTRKRPMQTDTEREQTLVLKEEPDEEPPESVHEEPEIYVEMPEVKDEPGVSGSNDMSNWRVNEQPPTDFFDLLYDEEDPDVGEESGDEHDEFIDDEDEDYLHPHRCSSPERTGSFPHGEPELSYSPEAPAYSPLSSPERPTRRLPQTDDWSPRPSASRDRSRSPIIWNLPSESVRLAPQQEEQVVIRIFGEDGQPLDAEVDDGAIEEVDLSAFLSPDAHALYVSPEEREMNDSERNERGAGERGAGERRIRRRRGVRRGVRGQNVSGRGYPNRGLRGNNQWKEGHPLNEIWTKDEDVPPELVSLATDVLQRRQMRMQGAARAERDVEREIDSESENGDEFFDTNDGGDSLPRLEGQNLHFEWSTMESFQGQEENFRPERTGSVHHYTSAYDAFRSYWGDDVLGLIVAETNLYATKITNAAFQSEWHPTNIHEILCLFSFWMMLGIVRMPTVVSCFSVDPLLKTEVFRRIFTRRRYELLTRALNFVDSDPAVNNYPNPSNISAASSSDLLYRLRPIITHLNSSFQANYILHKDICIDESLTLWKGRLKFKQYIQNKAAKFGIKTFELCESSTGYLWSFIVYSGKQSATDLEQSPGVLKSTAVVKKLIGPLLNKGYRLFMDNWYNSPLLARFLKLNGTDCVGTLRASRRDVPPLVNKAPLKRGDFIARHSGDVSILSWQDKKRVTMISTCHGSATALPTVSSRPPYRPTPFKPQVVLDYNKFMGGVDMKDQMLEPYLIERKRCAKWYMKLFKRWLNVSILNARILLESSTQKHQDHLGFRLSLVDSILTNHLSHCPQSRRFTVSSSRSTHQQPQKLVPYTHWPVLLEQTEYDAAHNRNSRKRCIVCLRAGKKTQKTPYCCETCQVPLCILNCFKSYHTPQ